MAAHQSPDRLPCTWPLLCRQCSALAISRAQAVTASGSVCVLLGLFRRPSCSHTSSFMAAWKPVPAGRHGPPSERVIQLQPRLWTQRPEEGRLKSGQIGQLLLS